MCGLIGLYRESAIFPPTIFVIKPTWPAEYSRYYLMLDCTEEKFDSTRLVFLEVGQTALRTRQSVFQSPEPWGVDVCFFLSAVWTVSHTCQTHPHTNGRPGSHSLNQPPAARACVDVC